MKLKRVEPMIGREPWDFEIVPWNESPSGEYTLSFVRPGCRFDRCVINIRKGEPRAPVFGWDGNRDTPTITPSIGCDHRCGWHGNITNGELNP